MNKPASELIALADCPFCGSGNISDRHVRDGRQIFCINCGASVAPTFHGPRGDTLDRAKEAWNTRSADQSGSERAGVDSGLNDQDEVLLAYGLLWSVSTTDKRVHSARRELLKCLNKELQAKAISAARTTMALVRDIRQIKGATFASDFDAPGPSSGEAHGDGYCGCTERCKDRDNCQYDVKPVDTALATPSAQPAPVSGLHPSHITRSSDASTYDEVCVNCGATDITGGGWGKLAEPCPSEAPSTHGKPDGAVRTQHDKLHLFLSILDRAGGETSGNDDKWNWINYFCDDAVPLDTFNQASKRGLTRVTHDVDNDNSVVYLTDAGRAFITALHSPKIAAAETSPGDVLAMKEACKRIAQPWPGLTEDEATSEIDKAMISVRNRIAAAIDRLDVKAEAKSQEPEAVAWDTPPIDLPKGLHPKTANLVRRFANALAKKLRLAEERYGYGEEWAKSEWEDDCREHLYEHLEKGDPRDVAAYCAFMWHHGWITTSLTTRPEAQAVSVDAIKAALEPVFSFLDELAANATPGRREALNSIIIGGGAKLNAEGARTAISALFAGGR